MASGGGTGTSIAWTLRLEQGRARPVRVDDRRGLVGAACDGRLHREGAPTAAAALLLTAMTVSPALISPNGDAVNDDGHRLVHARQHGLGDGTLVNAAGVPTRRRSSRRLLPPGPQSFTFTGAGVADGPYTIALTATPAEGAPETVSQPITIDRTLANFAVSPSFSPAGNGPEKLLAATFQLVYPADRVLRDPRRRAGR